MGFTIGSKCPGATGLSGNGHGFLHGKNAITDILAPAAKPYFEKDQYAGHRPQ
jgi:hypothetical protein